MDDSATSGSAVPAFDSNGHAKSRAIVWLMAGIVLVAITPGLWMGNLEHLGLIIHATLVFMPAWAGAMYWIVRAERAHRAGLPDQAVLYGLVCAASMLPLVVIYAYFLPLPPSIIARTRAPDGTELCLTQKYDDFYQVSFYYRRTGQPWGWFYYDHEDTRWWRGSIALCADGRLRA